MVRLVIGWRTPRLPTYRGFEALFAYFSGSYLVMTGQGAIVPRLRRPAAGRTQARSSVHASLLWKRTLSVGLAECNLWYFLCVIFALPHADDVLAVNDKSKESTRKRKPNESEQVNQSMQNLKECQQSGTDQKTYAIEESPNEFRATLTPTRQYSENVSTAFMCKALQR